MTPNQRERLIQKAMSWVRVRTRPGDYLKVFGWSRSLVVDDPKASEAVLDGLRVLSEGTAAHLLIGSVDEGSRSIGAVSPEDFRRALSRSNKLDATLGGGHIRSANRDIGFLLDWSRSLNAPRSTLLGTVHESWLDGKDRAEALTTFLERAASASRMEYLLASHISDEARKLRGGIRYEATPGAGIPYVPWLLILGPAYIRASGSSAVNRLRADSLKWVGEFASIRTCNSPLSYGMAETVQQEEVVRQTLGPGLFLDSGVGSAGASGPKYPQGYVGSTAESAVTLEVYAKDGRIEIRGEEE